MSDRPVGAGVRNAGAPWIRCRAPRPAARARIVCLPHAGGAASFYGSWSAKIAADLELSVVQYPGREDRIAETVPANLTELADQIAASLRQLADRPLVLFGHSLGSLVAYEVARTLESREGITPAHLVVSGRRAPLVRPGGNVHRWPDEALVSELVRLGGTDGSLLTDPAIRSVFLPAIRADFRLAETYLHQGGQLLNCPVTAVIGTTDTEVNAETANPWAEHTSGPFGLRQLPGGHFYLRPEEDAVLELLSYASTRRNTQSTETEKSASPTGIHEPV